MMIPSLFLFGLADLQRKFFNCFSKPMYPMISYLITTALFPYLGFYLSVTLDMKIQGIALASFVSNFVTLLIMNIFFWFDKEMRPAF